ncbi:hypothetical protein ALC60_06782, partial [Trachymyrmex zeteki]
NNLSYCFGNFEKQDKNRMPSDVIILCVRYIRALSRGDEARRYRGNEDDAPFTSFNRHLTHRFSICIEPCSSFRLRRYRSQWAFKDRSFDRRFSEAEVVTAEETASLGMGQSRRRLLPDMFATASSGVSRLMDYVCQTLVVDACRHDV